MAINQEVEFNETLEKMYATNSHYIARIALSYMGDYIRKLLLLLDSSMSIGNTKLDFDITKFDASTFLEKH
jgi:hypothetical protein